MLEWNNKPQQHLSQPQQNSTLGATGVSAGVSVGIGGLLLLGLAGYGLWRLAKR